jgi:hypothetical protein
MQLSDDTATLYKMPVDEYVDLYAKDKIL